jgi:hypothetical protein
MVIVRVQDTGDVLGTVGRLDSLLIITGVERLEIETRLSARVPQTEVYSH